MGPGRPDHPDPAGPPGFLLLLNTFVLRPFQIPSGSMEQGLRIGDRVLVNKLAYRFGAEPQRGDVVVFDGTGYFGHADYIKRVVGVGGDHVVCCDKEGRIQVNGRLGRRVGRSCIPGDSPSTVRFDVVVPDGTLFVLGDHRSDSSDSRDHLGSPGGGMVPVDEVIGRADWIVWPFAHATRLHRPDAYAGVPAPAAKGGRPWVTAASRAASPAAPRKTCCPPAPGAPPALPAAVRAPSGASSSARSSGAAGAVAVKEIPLLVGVAVLIALVLKTFLVQAFVIPSGSMEQTIQIGDRVLVDKLTPWFGSKPQRGDVVVFKDPGGWLQDEQTTTPQDDPVVIKQVKEGLTFIGLLPSENEKDLIKRVVGVGGDRVKCCDTQGRVTVNGVPLNEDYLYPGQRPVRHAVRHHGPPGAVVGDGRPPEQLRGLPRPPGHRLRRHGPRGRGRGPCHGHRLALPPLEHAGGTENLRLRVRLGHRVDRCCPAVA